MRAELIRIFAYIAVLSLVDSISYMALAQQPSTEIRFTISCSEFKILLDALKSLYIVGSSENGDISKSTLENVEGIFNKYAVNCPELEDFEFD